MKRVKNWEEYRDNWAELGDFLFTIAIEATVGVGLGCLFLVLTVPCGLAAACGYRPSFEGEM